MGRKEKNCDPDDARRGDCWDHVAFDREADLFQPLGRHFRMARAISRRIVRRFLYERGQELDFLIEAVVDALRQGRGKNVLGHVR